MFEDKLQTLIAEHASTESKDSIIDAMERTIGTLRSQQATEQKASAAAE